MICGRCNEILHEPFMVLGASWLWKCIYCHWQLIAPMQYRRGRWVHGNKDEMVIEASGEVEVQECASPSKASQPRT